jgi:general stress protein 26
VKITRSREFLKSQKILRLATIDTSGNPHIVPVWYMYISNKFYVGTNTRTKKAKNIKKNPKVSFCVDTGIKSPDILGVMGIGIAKLILKPSSVELLAKKILLRYFKNLENKSAQQLLNETDCIIEIIPSKIRNWKY